MATITQTKLVGFCLGDKANYNATNYANHIWFDPTNKQILLNGIEYIPKKLSELVNDKNFLTSITKAMVEGVLTGNITSHTHSQYLPLTGGTLSGALTCNGDYINMNNDSGSRGYRGFFNQSNSTSRASGSHIFMKGGGEALGTNSVSIGYQAFAGIRNKDSDATTYPYIAWQWMPTEKFSVDTTNSATLSGGEYYGFPLLPNEMVQWNIGGQNVIYENSSERLEMLVVIKASDADTGLVFGGKTTLPYRASKTLIAGKYIVGAGEYLKNITEFTINDVKYYQVIIYTWNTTAFPTSYDFTQQVKVMCATKVNNSNYSGASSYASGYSSVASGYSSVASGYYSVASGISSVASGAYSVASGNYSVASGYYSVASGYYSVASGYYSVASGYYSVASGISSVASGYYSVASGYYSVASGISSVASGYYSVASHDHCAVLARNGETMSSCQTIVGKFNAKVAGLFIIGNGTSATARSNAFVVDDSGNVTAKYFSGYANAIGGEGIKVYATNSNEINFGGTASDTTIYFGYRSMDSRPTPTTYKFGADGSAKIVGGVTSFYYNYVPNNCDANVYTDGILWNYGSSAYWKNAPQGMDYGSILTLKSSYGNSLSGQLAWDINHNSTTDTTRYLWWRATDAGDWVEAKWHQIAFTDSNVATATALTSSAGSTTQPIYFSNGKPVACSYTLGKSVPSNAVFTDTTYSVATASADGLMSAAMYKAQMVKSVGIKQGEEMVKPDGTITITDHRVYITQDKSNINGVYQTASGDNDVKIPNATKDYDGSMSYTDKRKLDGISPYAPKKVVALRLSYTYGGVTVISGGGDYDMTQDAQLMQSASSEGVEENYNGINYYTTFSLDTAASSTDTLNQLFNNSFVKFSFMGKDTSYVPDTVDVKSSFDGDVLYVVFSSLVSQETWVVDCVWEFF